MPSVRNIAVNPNAVKPAKRQARSVGWQKPLYQVLSLDRLEREKPAPCSNIDNPLSLGDILEMAREGTS